MSLSLLDSLDSDTDSLVQEKAYQSELQKRIGNNGNVQIKENDLNIIYDSLEATPVTVDEQTVTDEEVTSDDEYTDLRYDPHWRRNYEEARLFHELRTRLSLEHATRDVSEGPEQSLGNARSLARQRGRGDANGIGHRVVPPSGLAEDHFTTEKSSSDAQVDLPASTFHLHPPEQQVVLDSSATSSRTHSPPASPVTAGARASHAPMESGLAKLQRRRHRTVVEGRDPAPDQLQRGDEACGTTQVSQGRRPPDQKRSCHRPSNARPARPRKDVVEENKTTLGKHPSKQGSYLSMYGRKREQPQEADEVWDSGADGQESREAESLDSEHLWHQRTQRLKVSQCQRERKSQPKEGHRKHDPPERARGPETRRRLGPIADRPPLAGHPHPQAEILVIDEAGSTSNASDTPTPWSSARSPPHPAGVSSPSAGRSPTLNLNINLNAGAAARLSPHASREQQDGLLTLVSPRAPQWMLRPPLFYPAPLRGPAPNPALLSPHAVAAAAGPVQWALVMASPSGPGAGLAPHAGQHGLVVPAPPGGRKGHSTGAYNWDPSLHSEKVNLWRCNAELSPEHAGQMSDPFLGSGSTTGSSGPYALLPPIGRAVSDGPEHAADGAQNHGLTMGPRSCSDGYLAQLERQRHTKAQTGYKAYTLKDYHSLKQNVKLGGLGPCNAVTEEMAEKMRRQKLYSEVIRLQNKKISRIPFLPAQKQPPAGPDKEAVAPRRKALEYARSIAKPKVSPRVKKETEETETEMVAVTAVPERVRYLGGVDAGQLTLLESLRRRHEQEKQAVAQLKVVHAI